MGNNIIPVRADATTINATWFNILRSVLDGDYLPRDSTGTPIDGAGNLGNATYAWLKLYFGISASGFTLEDDGGGNIVFKIGGVTKFTIGPNGYVKQPLIDSASSSCGNFSSGATSLADVTNLTTSISTTGRSVVLQLIDDGSLNLSGFKATDGPIKFAYFRGVTQLTNMSVAGAGSLATVGQGALLHVDVRPTAATYTYKVQAANLAGTGSMNFSYLRLYAYEL